MATYQLFNHFTGQVEQKLDLDRKSALTKNEQYRNQHQPKRLILDVVDLQGTIAIPKPTTPPNHKRIDDLDLSDI
jgi:hypothetical protein